MKIAVLGDIHSNYHALHTCVEHAIEKGAEHFLFLGDYVSDCAYPQKTMNFIYELKRRYSCWFIRGNREDYLLNHRRGGNDGWKIPSSASGSLLYTYENLTEKDFAFFEGLDISGRISVPSYPEFLFCHGSLEQSKGDLSFGSENAKRTLNGIDCNMIVCGHIHQQGIYEYNKKKIVNVGSVGIPWNFHGDAQYGILDGKQDQWEIELIHLNYDKEQAVRELYESKLNEKATIWVKLVEQTLRTGIDRSMECLVKALKKCEEKEGSAEWSNLSEIYWEEAAKEMGLT